METLRYQQEIIAAIKEKKELAYVDETLILEKMEKLFLQEPKLRKQLFEKEKSAKHFKEFSKCKAFDETLKKTRLLLREIYGVFIQPGYEKKETILSNPTPENAIKLLAMHQSSKERIPYYTEIYSKIFKITKEPKTILDLGCGLNPCSYQFMQIKPTYIASDLNTQDCAFLNAFFKAYFLPGNAIPFDLTKTNIYPKADVCFLFKVVDSLETAKRNSTRNLLKALPCKWVVVSFPKVSLGQKKTIPESKRTWFFTMLTYEHYKYERFEVDNELFILIEK